MTLRRPFPRALAALAGSCALVLTVTVFAVADGE